MYKLRLLHIVFFITMLGFNGFSQTVDKRLFVAVDGLAPALKFGIEKNTTERLSIKASFGFCLVGPSLISYNFFGSYKITKPERRFGVDLNFGLLDNYIDVIAPMFSLGFGGGVGIHYRFQNNAVLSLRTGIITGPAIDDKEFLMLTLPNFGIEYAFMFKKHVKEETD